MSKEEQEQLAARIGSLLGRSFAHFTFGVDGTLYCELCTEEVHEPLGSGRLSDVAVAALEHDKEAGHEA